MPSGLRDCLFETVLSGFNPLALDAQPLPSTTPKRCWTNLAMFLSIRPGRREKDDPRKICDGAAPDPG
jgi:hypothetical protein